MTPTISSALLQGLNAPQEQAVTLPPEPALLLAGAGTGKTRVLTTRIAWLISTSRVSPLGVLAVTFTNKAAREMLGRLSGMINVNLKCMWVGTFHGLCNRFLRAHHRDAALPATFQILDSQDQLSAIKRLIRGLGVDDEKYPPKQVQSFINSAKEQGLRALMSTTPMVTTAGSLSSTRPMTTNVSVRAWWILANSCCDRWSCCVDQMPFAITTEAALSTCW